MHALAPAAADGARDRRRPGGPNGSLGAPAPPSRPAWRAVPARPAGDRDRHGRRGGKRGLGGHERGDRRAAARRERGRRRGRPRPACSASSSRTRAASAAAASCVIRDARRPDHDDRRPRDGAGSRCSPTRSSRTAPPLAFNDARWSGLSVGVPGTVAHVADRAAQVRHVEPRPRAQRGHDGRPPRLRGRPDVLRPDRRRNATYFDDIPSTAAIYLDPDGTPHDVGTVSAQPGPRQHVRAPRPLRRAARSTAARWPRRWRRPPSTRRRAPTANHTWRPGLLTEQDLAALPRDRARAHARRLPRPRRLGHGPAVERRLDRRRGAEHPQGLRRLGADRTRAYHRYLEASRLAYADRGAYLADPAFFDVPLARPAVGLLRRRARAR